MLSINSYYSFNTKVPGILGESFNNLKLVSVMTYELASNYINVVSMHANIYPALPQGIPDNPESYTYYLFKTESNTNVVLADVWIDDNTITEKGSQSMVVEIPRVTNSDIVRLNTVLRTMGFNYTSRVV
jgi:hypothetical protein